MRACLSKSVQKYGRVSPQTKRALHLPPCVVLYLRKSLYKLEVWQKWKNKPEVKNLRSNGFIP